MVKIEFQEKLATFIDCLFELASTTPVTTFKNKIFEQLNNLIGVDAGIWFSRSDMDRPLVEYWQEDTQLYGLPDDFMGNYQRLVQSSQEEDPFHQFVLSHPNQVVSIAQAYDSLSHWRETIYYKQHSGLFSLKDVITVLVTPKVGRSQTTHVISLYRKEGSPLFSSQDKQLLSFIYPLLQEAFRNNLFSMVNGSFVREQNKGVMAIVDRYGLVLEADRDFKKILELDNSVSLVELVSEAGANGTSTKLHTKSLEITTTFSSGLFFVKIVPARFISELNSQQRKLCRLIRDGYSDADIEKRLGISNRQVRYLMEQTFECLGVSNRNSIFILLVRLGIES